jgi:hypothetical protein
MPSYSLRTMTCIDPFVVTRAENLILAIPKPVRRSRVRFVIAEDVLYMQGFKSSTPPVRWGVYYGAEKVSFTLIRGV